MSLWGQHDAPVTVIVAGPDAALFFDDAATNSPDGLRKRWSADAAWVLADTPENLILMLRKALRSGADISVLLPLVPMGTDEMAMRGEWKRWRQAVTRCAVRGAKPVPVYAAVYACLGGYGDTPAHLNSMDAAGVWPDSAITMRQAVKTVRASSARMPPRSNLLRERLALATLDWAAEAALLVAIEEIASTPPFFLAGLLLVDGGTAVPDSSAWARWITARTGLRLSIPSSCRVAPALPSLNVEPAQDDGGEPPIPPREVRPRKTRRSATLAGLFVAAVLLSGGFAYWQTHQEIRRMSEGVSRYEAVPQDRIFAKCDALLQITEDQREFKRRLAYGGIQSWLDELAGAREAEARMSAAIAAYRPPPTSLRMDTMTTFEPGNARVQRHTARRLLEPVAILLRANPDLRVRIVGHTDATGNPQENLLLSLARAQAVRDELMAMSGADPASFDVAGMGAAQPRGDNALPAGRALNRRVEVSLTPAASARFACDALQVNLGGLRMRSLAGELRQR
ncbi:OmpA family protein [Achromobacter arsenitoxydans]|uniref:OmpA/MotB domain-containing protein n=1 Tax=Achromobacter arsenitoxydans SY8 TaxID=477184 RepID=H0F1Y5_9BURK|nr:OmpA family protein [Achromobacter arsenitoxydans]EHK67711.1 OmpA/MotB domain-containing protein [Achromobacter arsenitoxydans SY8]